MTVAYCISVFGANCMSGHTLRRTFTDKLKLDLVLLYTDVYILFLKVPFHINFQVFFFIPDSSGVASLD